MSAATAPHMGSRISVQMFASDLLAHQGLVRVESYPGVGHVSAVLTDGAGTTISITGDRSSIHMVLTAALERLGQEGGWGLMRRPLVVFLALAAAVLSFDALRAQALASGAVHHPALAWIWPAVVDGMVAAGVLGVRADRRDWRAWAMFALAFGASIGFQTTTPPLWLARSVPPVALLLAVVVLELPRARRKAERPTVSPDTDAEVTEGGALPGALPVLAEAWTPEMSGAELARALGEHGLQVGDRDARRLLTLLRAAPAPSTNGDRGEGRKEGSP